MIPEHCATFKIILINVLFVLVWWGVAKASLNIPGIYTMTMVASLSQWKLEDVNSNTIEGTTDRDWLQWRMPSPTGTFTRNTHKKSVFWYQHTSPSTKRLSHLFEDDISRSVYLLDGEEFAPILHKLTEEDALIDVLLPHSSSSRFLSQGDVQLSQQGFIDSLFREMLSKFIAMCILHHGALWIRVCVHLFIQNKFHANRVLNFASSTTQNAHKSSCWIPDFQLFRMKLGHCWKYGELYWHQRIYMADAEILSCIG